MPIVQAIATTGLDAWTMAAWLAGITGLCMNIALPPGGPAAEQAAMALGGWT